MCGNFLVFALCLWLNLGMATRLLTPVTVTVEYGDTTVKYTAPEGTISGNGDPYHPVLTLTLDRYKRAGRTTIIKEKGKTESPSTEQEPSPEATAMIEAAKDAEEAVFVAAKIIQEARLEAQQRIHDANHVFNLAVLKFMHTGKTNLDATKVLEAANIWATEDRTEAVACNDVDKLYGVDRTDIGL